MKNLNEGQQDSLQNLLGGFNNDSDKSNLDMSSVKLTNKSKKKKSIFSDDEIPLITPVQSTQIIIPKPLQIEIKDLQIQAVKAIQNVEEVKEKTKARSKKKDKTSDFLMADILSQKIQEIKEDIELITGEILPEEINIIQIEEDIDTALAAIPGGDAFDITDIEIIPSKIHKDKTGYYKVKTNIKKDNIPNIINSIASYVKKMTKGLISPRVCDLRVIGNTNKTQLRNAKYKLSAATVVFKPDFEKLKVNKGTRFMISIPENHVTTGNLLVYLQESRAKTILEISASEFKNINFFVEFIGDRIAEYYFHGYDVTLKKLELRGTNNPLMQVVTNVLNSGEYFAKPYTDADNHLFSVDFRSKGTLNQWLYINIIEGEMPGTYEVIAKNDADQTWEFRMLQTTVTIGWLIDKCYDLLKKAYERDWTKELDIQDSEDSFFYMYNKLTHFKLRKAIVDIHAMADQAPGIEIKKTLSKKDLVEMLKQDYDSEAIIGKTEYLDYFILTYYAHQIIGGDIRAGKDYITTQKYYQKYNVKDRRDYPEREKTIIKKEGIERNYNSRIYVFQLEYKVKNSADNKVYIYRSVNFNDLVEATGFLTTEIKFPASKF